MLLPSDCRITNLIVSWCHDQVANPGRGITINQVMMSCFGIIGLSIVVRSVISIKMCKMQENGWPTKRQDEWRSFTFSGIDMFGSFVLKNGHKKKKQYEVLYTCLSSRAIHIEITCSLNSDFFIRCLRLCTLHLC